VRVEERGPVAEVAWAFLKLGFTAFGGPAAHIAMMRDEFVMRRKWVSEVEFLDLISAANLIPGPNSTEVAIHLGHRRAGVVGLIVAGACFIVPAMLIVIALAWAYTRYGSLPETRGLLYGMKPVVVAIVLQALVGFGKPILKTPVPWIIGLAVFGCSLLGLPEIWLVFIPGILLAAFAWKGEANKAATRAIAWTALAVLVLIGGSAWLSTMSIGKTPFALAPLFLVFVKVGAVLYGSGYVLLSYLNTDLVVRLGWLTRTQLLDAVSVGQFTPGPVFTTATFIGFLLGGIPGAIVATVGIFLPSFVLVALSAKWVRRLRESASTAAFLEGVNAASIGLMAAVVVKLGQDAMVDWLTWPLAIIALAILLRFKINSFWLVAAGAIAGLVHASL